MKCDNSSVIQPRNHRLSKVISDKNIVLADFYRGRRVTFKKNMTHHFIRMRKKQNKIGNVSVRKIIFIVFWNT